MLSIYTLMAIANHVSCIKGLTLNITEVPPSCVELLQTEHLLQRKPTKTFMILKAQRSSTAVSVTQRCYPIGSLTPISSFMLLVVALLYVGLGEMLRHRVMHAPSLSQARHILGVGSLESTVNDSYWHLQCSMQNEPHPVRGKPATIR